MSGVTVAVVEDITIVNDVVSNDTTEEGIKHVVRDDGVLHSDEEFALDRVVAHY